MIFRHERYLNQPLGKVEPKDWMIFDGYLMDI